MRIFALILCLSLWQIQAIQAQESRTISLEEAIEIALENNVNIKQARNAVELGRVGVSDAQAQFLPNLNSTISGQRQIGRQFVQEAIAFDDITTTGLNANLQSNIVLFDGLRNINDLRQSRASLKSQEEVYERTREIVIFNTAQAYLNVLIQDELLKINQDNLETRRRQLEQVEAQVEVGMRPTVDLYNQEALLANAELEVVRNENQLNFRITELIGILQIDPLMDYEFVIPDIESELIPQHHDLEELVRIALTNRRDMVAAQFDIEAAEYGLQSARGARMPVLSASAFISTRYSDQQREQVPNPNFDPTDPESSEFIFRDAPFSDQIFDHNINRGITLNLTIPIFNRFQTRNAIQRQQIAHKNAVLELESLETEIFQDVRQAYNDYVGYSKELESTQKVVRAAERAFETEQERYNVGSATLIELTEANSVYVDAQINYVLAQYRFVFQEKLLDFFLGRLTADTVQSGF